jgi:hypothetical protein
MPRIYPCEHCGEVIHENQEYVLLAPAGNDFEKRLHADCYKTYKEKQKDGGPR